MVSEGQAAIGVGKVDQHMLQVGGPDAEGIGGKAPACSLAQRGRNRLQHADCTQDLGNSGEGDYQGRGGHPRRNDGDERSGQREVQNTRRAIEQAEYPERDGPARQVPAP